MFACTHLGRDFSKTVLTLLTLSFVVTPPAVGFSSYLEKPVLAQPSIAPGIPADQLFQEGQKRLVNAQNQMALAHFQQALKLYRQGGDRQGEANTLSAVGDAQYNLEKYEQALESYSQALVVYRQLDDRKGEATTLNNIGAVYESQKQYPQALKFYEQALKLRQAIGDLAGEGTTLNNLAGVYLSQGDFDRALREYSAALKNRWLMGDRWGEATTLNNIGFVCRRTAQFHQSKGDAEKSREWYKSALDHYQASLAIRRMLKDRLGEATTLNNLGFIYRSLADYPDAQNPKAQETALDEARRTYLRAAEIFSQLGDRKGEATALNNLGGIYFNQGKYSEALKVYERALIATRITNNLPEQATTLSNIAFIYRTQADAARAKQSAPEGTPNAGPKEYEQQYMKALDFYQQALAIIRRVGDRESEGATLNNIGGVNISLERYTDAMKAYQAALQIYEQLNDLPGQGTTRYNIGVTYAHQEKYTEALNFYKGAKTIYEKLSDNARSLEIINAIKAIENRQKAI